MAGPVESRLAKNGEKFFDRIETLAPIDPEFANLLGSVWQNNMTDDFWERVSGRLVQTRAGWHSEMIALVESCAPAFIRHVRQAHSG